LITASKIAKSIVILIMEAVCTSMHQDQQPQRGGMGRQWQSAADPPHVQALTLATDNI
jgi:hypothetical protein